MEYMLEKLLSLAILLVFSVAFPAILICIIVPFELRDNLSVGTGMLFVYTVGVTIMYLRSDVK